MLFSELSKHNHTDLLRINQILSLLKKCKTRKPGYKPKYAQRGVGVDMLLPLLQSLSTADCAATRLSSEAPLLLRIPRSDSVSQVWFSGCEVWAGVRPVASRVRRSPCLALPLFHQDSHNSKLQNRILMLSSQKLK